MITTTIRNEEYSSATQVLYLAFELGDRTWKLFFSFAPAQKPRERTIPAGDLKGLLKEIRLAKARFELHPECAVLSCYEAGQDGFSRKDIGTMWLHRFLLQNAVHNLVVDSSSLEVNRRKRRTKTDRVDGRKLVSMLMRHATGEKKIWHVIHVPGPEQEDARHLHRNLETAKHERTQHRNRIRGLLVSSGLRLKITANFPQQLQTTHLWDGSPLPPGLHARLLREWQHLQLVEQQIHELEQERSRQLRDSTSPSVAMARHMMRLKGIGPGSAYPFAMEFFGWRNFRNPKEVGASAGLTPTPSDSGESSHELGISKAGNVRIRALAIEIAWGWLYFQPQSHLSRWYANRFGHGGSRLRRIGIVALARKLLIALWRYVEFGVIPEGAVLKA